AKYHYMKSGIWTTVDLAPQTLNVPATTTGCQIFGSDAPPKHAQFCPSCNKVADPIDPATGGMYLHEVDFKMGGSRLQFKRSYDSTSTLLGDLGVGWRHSFSRKIRPHYVGQDLAPYTAGIGVSSIYADEPIACVSA